MTDAVQTVEDTWYVVGSITVVHVMTCCALLYFMLYLKATLMQVQHSLL